MAAGNAASFGHQFRLDRVRPLRLRGHGNQREKDEEQAEQDRFSKPFGLSLSKPCPSYRGKTILRQAQDERVWEF
jgi:hypothetical protein